MLFHGTKDTGLPGSLHVGWRQNYGKYGNFEGNCSVIGTDGHLLFAALLHYELLGCSIKPFTIVILSSTLRYIPTKNVGITQDAKQGCYV